MTSVTIAINNFNYADYLGGAIDSALAQSHPDVQVVVVDDGSSDSSRDVIASYGDRIVAVLKDNGGQASAFNAGFAAAEGDVVIFLDADDLLDPETATMVANAFERDRGVALVQYRLRLIGPGGEPLGAVRPNRANVMASGDLSHHVLKYRCYHWQPTSGNAFAAAALRRILPVPEDTFRVSADAYLAALIPLCGPIVSLDDIGGSYRVHTTSNFTGAALDGRFFRQRLAHVDAGHRALVQLAPQLGVPSPPEDPARLLDAAYLAFRLGSLELDRDAHPYGGDRRAVVAARGVRASLANPLFSYRNRLRRAGWFVAAGLAPSRRLRRAAIGRMPDTPARRTRLLARRRAVTH